MADNLDRQTSDPTSLTTAQILREVSLVKDLVEARLDGMDKAVIILQDTASRSPTVQEISLQNAERFSSIDKQFGERDVRTQQSAEAATTAVNAALQAQKESAGKQAEAFQEATSKSEQQFTKQIDQQGELLRTEVRGLVTQINELKDRFNRGEGKGEGVDKHANDSRLWIGVLIAIASLMIGVCGIVIAVLLRKP